MAQELRAGGETLEDVFAEVVSGFAAVTERGTDLAADRMPLLLRATEPDRMLDRFVTELLDLARDERFAAGRLERFTIDHGELRAAVSGWSGTVRPLVAGVARSQLRYDADLAWWRAAVLLS